MSKYIFVRDYQIEIIRQKYPLSKYPQNELYEKFNHSKYNCFLKIDDKYFGLSDDYEFSLYVDILDLETKEAKRIAQISYYDGKISELHIESEYKKYGLDDFLIKYVVEHCGGYYTVCENRNDYNLYRKNGFIPVPCKHRDLKLENAKEYAEAILSGKEKLKSAIYMVDKNSIRDNGDLMKKFVEFADANYQGK